ncbi:hypothetical protein ACH0BF_07415 [Pseudobacillus sp. 179-B 2D1 NHS]|uniref:hypothetical protein n=1 Tax=Pseudobacillus sp. 179-B 2D1 NHS TaxID=3374292 RepID=UPI00387998DE
MMTFFFNDNLSLLRAALFGAVPYSMQELHQKQKSGTEKRAKQRQIGDRMNEMNLVETVCI